MRTRACTRQGSTEELRLLVAGSCELGYLFLALQQLSSFTREQTVFEIAGDNASYKRDAFLAYSTAWRDGFWEPEFHRLLRAEGKTLAFAPGSCRYAEGLVRRRDVLSAASGARPEIRPGAGSRGHS
jgi:hypothetical protein